MADEKIKIDWNILRTRPMEYVLGFTDKPQREEMRPEVITNDEPVVDRVALYDALTYCERHCSRQWREKWA